jgi:hypothetical protein
MGLNADIHGFANRQFPTLAYATKKDAVNAWWIVVAHACVERQNLPTIVPGRALRCLQALQPFGFTVKPWPAS